MQLFCDHCGTEFTPKVLRAESRFCSCCGKPLSEYIKEHAFENAFRSRGLLPSPDDQINESFVKREVKKRKNRESPDDKDLMLSPARSTPIRMRTRQRELIPNGDSGRSDAALDTSTEDTESLGKGKRIRKSTQRYLDEYPPSLRDRHRPQRTPDIPVVSLAKDNSSLSAILNSAPQLPPVARASLQSPLRLSLFKLPAPFHVPAEGNEEGTILKRESISHVLGGSQKTTFPYPRDRTEGPTYACIKESENELVPKNPGEHGIIFVRSLPDHLPHEAFNLFVKNKGTIYWSYCGIYRVIHKFTMTKDQWKSLSERTRNHKVQVTLRSQWGKAWCIEKGVMPTDEGMTQALDEGIMTWQATVIECIDYDANLLRQLMRAQ